MEQRNLWDIIEQYADDPLKILEELGGYYEVLKDKEGNRLTPLVGYAGKYQTSDGKELQYVGDVYANFAKAEEHPGAIAWFTKVLWEKLITRTPTVYVGPQMGGVAVAQFLAYHAYVNRYPARYACAEKIVTQVKTDTLREQSELQFARHSVNPGDSVIIAEDVLNNFSTTSQLIGLVEKQGGHVRAITALLNRSMTIKDEYIHNGKSILVIPLVYKPYPEYKQDDPEVVKDIEKDNVVRKPKNEWEKLMEPLKAMRLAMASNGS